MRISVGNGSLPPSVAKMFWNIGTTNNIIAVTSSSTKHDTTNGIRHRRLHLAAQLDLLLDRGRQSLQDAVEHTAGLTGAHHRHEEAIERLRVLGERGGERCAPFDVEPNLIDDFGERLALGLFGEDVERPQHREPGADHRRELTREDRDVLELDPVGQERDLEVACETLAALLLDLDRHVAHRAQLAHDELRVLRLELAFDQLSGLVADFVGESLGHRDQPFICRRRSSSLLQRSRAMSMVIRPLRTS